MIMEDTDTTDNGSALEKKASIRFEDDFDYKPLKKGAGASLEDKLFGLLRGKKKNQDSGKAAGEIKTENGSPCRGGARFVF